MACLRHCDTRLLRHLAQPRYTLLSRSASCAVHRCHLNGCVIRGHDPYWMDFREAQRCDVLIGNGGTEPYQMKLCCLACDY